MWLWIVAHIQAGSGDCEKYTSKMLNAGRRMFVRTGMDVDDIGLPSASQVANTDLVEIMRNGDFMKFAEDEMEKGEGGAAVNMTLEDRQKFQMGDYVNSFLPQQYGGSFETFLYS